MLSRVADSLYWMARYLERAENTARLLDVHQTLMLDQLPDENEKRWQRVLASLGLDSAEIAKIDQTEIVRSLSTDASNPASIVTCIASSRENARQIRDGITEDMWEQLNRLYFTAREAIVTPTWKDRQSEFFKAVREGASLFYGIADDTLAHNEGYRFINLGRSLERTLMKIALLEAHQHLFIDEPEEDHSIHLEYVALLKRASAFEAYVREYTANLKAPQILDFLLLNPEFPHSVRYGVNRIVRALEKIEKSSPRRGGARLHRECGKLLATLQYSHIDEVLSDDLVGFLGGLRERCESIHNLLYAVHITYDSGEEFEAG